MSCNNNYDRSEEFTKQYNAAKKQIVQNAIKTTLVCWLIEFALYAVLVIAVALTSKQIVFTNLLAVAKSEIHIMFAMVVGTLVYVTTSALRELSMCRELLQKDL